MTIYSKHTHTLFLYRTFDSYKFRVIIMLFPLQRSFEREESYSSEFEINNKFLAHLTGLTYSKLHHGVKHFRHFLSVMLLYCTYLQAINITK